MQPEAKFKKHLREGFEALHAMTPHYWFPIVASMMQKSGIPDLFVADGKIGAWIEAKVNGNELSSLQVLECRKLAMAGQIVVVVHCNLDPLPAQRVVDWSRFTRDGMIEHIPAIARWTEHKTADFWRKVIHGA